MDNLPKALEETIEYFSRLPGIGKKTANRLAFSLLTKTPDYLSSFGTRLSSLHENISECKKCFHLCEKNEEQCGICKNTKRETDVLCIVESSLDLMAMEKSGMYSGKYFVLGGVISPMNGIGPEELRIGTLLKFSQTNEYKEIIFALSSTMEGEATTIYISDQLKKTGYSNIISRIARGISLGSQVQYTDENTLQRAFSGRGKI